MVLRIFGAFLCSILILFPFNEGNAQGSPACNTFFSPDTLSIACGDTTLLDPIVGSSQIGDDFNDSQLDSGWSSSQTMSFYDSLDCLEEPVNDGTPFAWMGPSATQPRNLTTVDLDVECGGQICFDMIFGSENSSGAPCEGPDQPGEGVALQYSVDDGNTWEEIYYFNPDSCNDGTTGCGGDGNAAFINWDNYCFNVPDSAMTDSTQFRWWQSAGSGTNFDHWGVDNVFVVGSSCDTAALQFSYDSGATYMSNPDTAVYPASDTSYNLFVTDTLNTDTCYADVHVQVDKPDIEAVSDDSLICDNDSTVLHTTDSCYYTLEMQDAGFSGGWDGGYIEVFKNGTSIGTFSALSSSSATVDSFLVAHQDSISLEYNAGSQEDENTYQLYDSEGNLIFQDGPTPATGAVFTLANATCVVSAPNYTPVWSPDSSLSSATANAPVAYPDTTTEYVLDFENSGNPQCDLSDTTEVVVEPWGGNTSFSYSSGTYCWDAPNQMPTINGVSGGTFWAEPAGLDIDSTTGEVDVTNSAADSTYSVYYKTPGTQCSFTDTVPFTIDTNSNADFEYADTTYCETASPVSPTYYNNGSQGNFWTNDPGLALDSIYGTVDIPNSDTGVYWVYNEIPVSGSCPTDLDSAKIVIEVQPEVQAGPDDTICDTETHVMDGSFSGGASDATWITQGDGTFDDVNDTNATYTPGPSDKNSGDVEILIESDSIKACNVDRDTMMLKIQESPVLDVGADDTICADESKNVTANLSGTGNGVKWQTTGDGFFDDSTSSSTVYHPGSNDRANGSVTIYADSKGAESCQTDSDSLELTILPLADPTFSYPRNSYCKSGSDPVPNIQGDSGGVFTVDPPGGMDIDSSTGAIDLSDSYADNYDVTYTVGDRCPNDTTVPITIEPTPGQPGPQPFSVCPSQTNTLSVSGNPDSVAWYDDANGNNVVGTDSTFTPDPQDLSQPGDYTYYVKVFNNGCPSEMGSVTVTVDPFADVGIATVPDPPVGVKPFEVTLQNASGTHVVDYDMDFGNGTSASNFIWTDTNIVYPQDGQYTVTVTGVDSMTGCSGSAKVIIDVTNEAQAQLPNVFTPNGDGENDLFKPRLNVPCPEGDKQGVTCWNGIKSFQGTIFNRWGNKIYQWDNWSDAWDGGDSPDGTYYYVIEALGENDEQVEYKGQVTLMRDE